jgi:hypothetical protein
MRYPFNTHHCRNDRTITACHKPSTMLPPTPPPSVKIPAFSYRSPSGSYSVEPLIYTINTVSATSPQGGYPDINNTMRDLTATQIRNTLRLLAVIWGINNQEIILGLFGGPLDSKMAAYLAKVLQNRFGAVVSNPIYHMVQEAVECHDFGVHVRNLARTATLWRQAIPGETPAEMLVRQDIANEYQRAALDLRDRALARLDILIADPTFINAAGGAQAARLKIIRDHFAVDPFEGLNADDDMELSYFKLHNNAKKEFWLSRYDENVVAWYW